MKWCNNCKEESMVIKVYIRQKDNKKCRVMYCANFGCANKVELPFSESLEVEKLTRG
jgi:hypothetical protein